MNRSSEEMEIIRREVIQLRKTNPSLSESKIAKHCNCSQPTVSRILSDYTTCNKEYVIQRYGGGVRYHCPKCDQTINSIYWTNASPINRNCNNLVIQPRS